MPTNAKPVFDRNIQRASYFLDIHEAGQGGVGAPAMPMRELPRGAIVFAVGAVDAYISEVSAEVIVRQLQAQLPTSSMRDLLKAVQREIPTLSLEVALLATQGERITRIREAIVDHFHSNVSSQGSKAVAAAVQRTGRPPADLWNALGGAGYPDAAGRLDDWTEIRHQIVHRGQSPQVRRPQARGFIDLAIAMVDRVDAYAEVV